MKLKCFLLIYSLMFSTQVWALDLYAEKKKIEVQSIEVSQRINSEKQIEVLIKNISSLILNPIFPITSQFVDQKSYSLIKDGCSYKVLYPEKNCLIVLKKNSEQKLKLTIYPYGKIKDKKELILGTISNEPIKEKIPDLIKELPPLPLVERIGIGNSYEWEIKLPERTNKISVLNDNEDYFAKISMKNEDTALLKIYPLKEDYFNVSLKLVSTNVAYSQPLKFTAIVRKPSKIIITPDLLKIQEGSQLVELKVKAEYSSGIPKIWDIPVSLLDWIKGDNLIFKDQQVFYVPKEAGLSELQVEAFGIKSDDLKFSVVKFWPYGLEKELIVKANEIKEITGLIHDYENIYIEKNGTLRINSIHPWVFLGVKHNFINEGKIVFTQKYSGDLSTNVPNFDGSLTGEIFSLVTPINSQINGGNIYVKTENFKGLGSFQLIGENEGTLVVDYLNLNSFSGWKPKNTKIRNYKAEIFEKQIITKDESSSDSFWASNFKSSGRGSWYYIVRYMVVAGLPFLCLYVFFYKRIEKNKIQKEKPQRKQIFKEIFYSIISAIAINFIVAFFITNYLSSLGWVKIYTDVSKYGLFYYILSYFLILVLHDTYFYLTHRVLHTKWFYEKIHKIHHDSQNPTPLTALSFHPVEALGHFLFIPLITIILPFHNDVISFFLWFMLIFNANGHSGFEYWSSWWLSGWRLKTINNSTHHNMHHEHYRYNYSLYFNWLDRLFKTNHPDYEKKVKREKEQ